MTREGFSYTHSFPEGKTKSLHALSYFIKARDKKSDLTTYVCLLVHVALWPRIYLSRQVNYNVPTQTAKLDFTWGFNFVFRPDSVWVYYSITNLNWICNRLILDTSECWSLFNTHIWASIRVYHRLKLILRGLVLDASAGLSQKLTWGLIFLPVYFE